MIRLMRPYLMLSILLFTTAGSLFGSNGYQYNFQQYSVDQGLPQSQVNAIHEDSRGFIWFATQGGGVARFDGNTFVQYEEIHGLAGQIVNCITEDSSGTMWFGSTWGGVSRFDGRGFKNFGKGQGVPENEITAIIYDQKSNSILLGTKSGLTVYNYIRFDAVEDLDGKKNLEITSFHRMIDGRILIGTASGAFIKNGSAIDFIDGSHGLSVLNVASDSTRIWLATESGLFAFSQTDFKEVPLPEILEKDSAFLGSRVNYVHYDAFGQLWFGADGSGVFLLRDTVLYHFNEVNGLTDVHIGSVFTDRSGRTWIGTHGSGVFRFNGFAFTYFMNMPGLGLPDVFSMVRDNNGVLWLATMSEGLFRYDGQSIKQFTEEDGLPSNSIRMIRIAKNGDLLLATLGGFSVFNGKRFMNYGLNEGLPASQIRCVLQARNGSIWIGTAGGGAVLFDGQKFRTFSLQEGLNHEFVHSLYEDARGNIWMGTGAGINRYSDGVIESFGEKEGLCNTYVGSIAEDRFGNIWVGTDKCVSRFNGRRFTNYGVEDGLSSGTVYLLAMDPSGNMIVGTNKGFDIVRFSAYGQISQIRNYNRSDGFLGIECNSNSILLDDDGSIWLGTVKGVIRYNPKEDPEAGTRPNIHITGVKLFYDEKWLKNVDPEKLDWFGVPDGYVFRYDQNNITFSYTGICMSYPDAIQFSCMLEGFDKQWSPLTTSQTASYSNLPPGKYVFRVKAKSKNGLWSIPDARFSFSIAPAFWQTWWFFLLLLVALVYGIFYVNVLMQRNVLRQNELLEEKVNIRTQEILKQKEEKEILLKEIHHRVKNNMQVIVSLLNIHADYIKDPESLALIEDSKSRIKSMALIHEKLYETRNFSRVNIGEYLDTLVRELVDTYGLDTEVHIDKKIEADSFGFDTLIPLGLLLNEIVSNSLKYAFPDRNEGTLIFHLKKHEDRFELLIGDDGIGMPKERFSESNKTLGVDLIRILTEQLNGTIEILEGKGTVYRILFESIDKQRI